MFMSTNSPGRSLSHRVLKKGVLCSTYEFSIRIIGGTQIENYTPLFDVYYPNPFPSSSRVARLRTIDFMEKIGYSIYTDIFHEN